MTNAVLPSPELVANRVLTKAQLPNPPVNLEKVVRIWTGLSVVEEELDGSGYLLPLGKLGAEIVVSKLDSPERRRFTIAHELGHWVLGLIWKKKTGEFSQPAGVAREHIEKWCDSFATNLLMPREFVGPWLSEISRVTMIDTLLRGPRLFEVSEQTFFIRAWELSKIQVLSLRRTAVSGQAEFEIEKNYAGESNLQFAAQFLQVPDVQTQLRFADSTILFAGTRNADRFYCSGRKVSSNRALIAIKWERADLQDPQVPQVQPGAS